MGRRGRRTDSSIPPAATTARWASSEYGLPEAIPTVVTTIDTASHAFAHLNPALLPNNRGVVFSVWYGPTRTDTDIGVADLKTGKVKILQRGLRAVYAPTGHLLIVRADGSLIALPFDQDRMVTTGPAVPVLSGIATLRRDGCGSRHRRGRHLAYYAGEPRDVPRDGAAGLDHPRWTRDVRGLWLDLQPPVQRSESACLPTGPALPLPSLEMRRRISGSSSSNTGRFPADLRGVPQVPAELESGRTGLVYHLRSRQQQRLDIERRTDGSGAANGCWVPTRRSPRRSGPPMARRWWSGPRCRPATSWCCIPESIRSRHH